MNKYKKGFTPIEAALISIDINSYKKNEHWPSNNQKVSCLNELKSTVRYIVCDLEKLEFETQELKYKAELDKFTCLEDDFIPQAEDLRNALIAETLLTQQYEQGNAPKKSLLEIYVPFYDVKFNGEFDPEKTQLTKESLAKWFDEADESEIANRFKHIKRSEKINLFKKGFTAEQAALIATKLEDYTSLIDATNAINEKQYQEAELHWQVEKGDYHGGIDDLDSNLTYEKIEIASSIKDALLEELPLVIELDIYEANYIDHLDCVGYAPATPEHTELLIYKEVKNTNNEIDFEVCLIEKESVAKWLFKNGQKDLASNVMPNIESLLKEKELAEHQRQKQWSQVTSSNTKEQSPEKLIIENKKLMDKVKELEDKNLDLFFKIPLDFDGDDVNHKVAKQEEISKNTFPSMTLKLQAMLAAQNKYWDNYDSNNISSQQVISNYIADTLGLKITAKGTNRTADELAKAIQPDDVKRK